MARLDIIACFAGTLAIIINLGWYVAPTATVVAIVRITEDAEYVFWTIIVCTALNLMQICKFCISIGFSWHACCNRNKRFNPDKFWLKVAPFEFRFFWSNMHVATSTPLPLATVIITSCVWSYLLPEWILLIVILAPIIAIVLSIAIGYVIANSYRKDDYKTIPNQEHAPA
jgi:hypothetical protein